MTRITRIRLRRAIAVIALCASAALGAAAQGRPEKIDLAKHLAALDPRWTSTLEAAPAAPAGFDDRRAYVALKNGRVVAVDLDRGDVQWAVDLTTAFALETGDGFVFAAAEAAVVALEDSTGRTAWRTDVWGPLAAPVYFDAGTLIVTKADGELMMLRAEDGAILWRRAMGAPLAVPPASTGDRLFAAPAGGGVVALERDSGSPIWTYKVPDVVTGLVALNDQVIVGTRGNRVYSFRPDRGRLRWEWAVGADVVGAAAADEERIYFGALDNMLRAVHRTSGNLQWAQPLLSRPAAGPILTGDVVIVPTVSAAIGAFLVTTGKPAFTITAAGELGGVPFLREGTKPTATRLVALSLEGTLQGFAPRYEPPPAPLAALPGIKTGS